MSESEGPDCTCYEAEFGHQPGCFFYPRPKRVSPPTLAYMSPRGAGIVRTVHSAEECERLMRGLLKRHADAVLRRGSEVVGEVDPDGGDDTSGFWWFDGDVFKS